MKYITLSFFYCLMTAVSYGQGIDFQAHTWEEAKSMAVAQGKIVFVDCYTTWCGPCKRLAKNLFPQEEVGSYFNEHFINLKMNMETPEGGKFGRQYSVSSYPTLYFIAPDGTVVQKTKGAPRDVRSLIGIASNAVSKYNPGADLANKYEAGDRSAATYLGMIQYLNRAGKPSLKFTNEYLRSAKDLTSDTSLQIIYHGMTQLDSRVFDHFIKHQQQIIDQHGAEAVHAKVKSALLTTASNAGIFESEDILQEGIDKYAKVDPAGAKAAAQEARIVYAIESGDADAYTKALSKLEGDEDLQIDYLRRGVTAFASDTDGRTQLIKRAKSMAKDGSPDYLILLTELYLQDGNHAEAQKTVEAIQAIEAPLDGEQSKALKSLIDQLGA